MQETSRGKLTNPEFQCKPGGKKPKIVGNKKIQQLMDNEGPTELHSNSCKILGLRFSLQIHSRIWLQNIQIDIADHYVFLDQIICF